MIPMYQHEWFSIPFRSLLPTTPGRLADAAFYRSFYGAFFQRYQSWADLGEEWLTCKDGVARFIRGEARSSGASTALSIGCGLGWVESRLREWEPTLRLELTELSDEALGWVRDRFPSQNIHVGAFPECIPPGRRYDLIFAHAMDYGLQNAQLVDLIRAARDRLNENGRFLLISATLDADERHIRRAARKTRAAYMRLTAPLQPSRGWLLWGWYRSRREYREVLASSGLTAIGERVIEGADFRGQPMYAIVGGNR